MSLILSTLLLAACKVSSVPEQEAVELITQGELSCRTTINGTAQDNISVPDNATCRLKNTNVQGNITVGTNARLIARGVFVEGNIQSEEHRQVVLTRSTTRISIVDGDVQIEEGLSAIVKRVKIGGNLQLEENDGRFTLSRNKIGGDLQANQNTGTGLRIFANKIDEDLQCQDNLPAPTGRRNTASSKEGQCINL